MKELLDKISSYNLFNYLLPGILFSLIASKITELNLIQSDVIIGVFLYYFIGLIISRLGSLVVEPFLKKIKFLKFTNYQDFVKVSDKDKKLEILSESNNMYRTLIAMFLLLILAKVYFLIASKWVFLNNYGNWFLIGLLLVLFVFSYRKQTNYITKRIKSLK